VTDDAIKAAVEQLDEGSSVFFGPRIVVHAQLDQSGRCSLVVFDPDETQSHRDWTADQVVAFVTDAEIDPEEIVAYS
jgi:hypothetical protein